MDNTEFSKQFQALRNNADSNIIVSLDKEWRICAINPAGQHFFNCTQAAWQGKDIFEFGAAHHWNPMPHIFQLSQSGYSWSLIHLPEPGEIQFMIVGSQSHYQLFLENILYNVPQYVVWKNRESVHLGCNQNFATLVGYDSPQDIIGRTNHELGFLSGDNGPDFIDARDQEILDGKHIHNLEQHLRIKSGKEVVLLTNKAPLRNEQGEVTGILVALTDITERKQKERELISAKEKAEIANRAKAEFVANISHDLRTPLNGILGIAQILDNNRAYPEQKELFEDLFTSSLLLRDLIEGILDFTELEAGEVRIEPELFSLRDMCEDIKASITYQIKQKHLALNINYSEDMPNEIISDSKHIRRILLNLVTNASKFTDSGSISVDVEAIEEAGQPAAKITVSDTGHGIPADKLESIFERFNRLTSSYDHAYKGLGLGLAIVRRLTENLGGSITVDSAVGEGSSFTVILPYKESQPAQKKLEAEKQQLKVQRGEYLQRLKSDPLTLLLVEDHHISQKITRSMLEDLGCKVDIASDGAETLEKLQDNRYQLILMDIGLPDIDGFSLTAKIRAGEVPQNDIPIIALTAHAQREDKLKCLEMGMDGFANKPITSTILKDVLIDFLIAHPEL